MITAILPNVSKAPRQVKQGFEEEYTPSAVKGTNPDLSRYNTLMKGGETA
jgi:hypothetical protein